MIALRKAKFFETQMKFFPCKVTKTKMEEGIISDYPVTFKMECEDPSHPTLWAIRKGENSDFSISEKEDFDAYGPNHLC